MLVSVIVPVYNVSRYLDECLESITRQTYTDVEIILIDDGSTDTSGAICDSYSERDNRIKVIHQKNSGLSAARNIGIEISKGDYLTFVDSDDYLSYTFIEKAIELCLKFDAQISVMKMSYFSGKNRKSDNEPFISYIQTYNAEQAISESLYQKKYSCCAPGKMYRRDVLEGISFPRGKLSEDLAVCHLIFNNASKVVYSNETGYYYRQRPKSIMHTFNKNRLDAIKWTGEIEEFCETHYPNLYPAALCRSFNVSLHLVLDLLNDDRIDIDTYNFLWNDIKRTRKSVICNFDSRFREKCAALLTYFGSNFLQKVWRSGLPIRNSHIDNGDS